MGGRCLLFSLWLAFPAALVESWLPSFFCSTYNNRLSLQGDRHPQKTCAGSSILILQAEKASQELSSSSSLNTDATGERKNQELRSLLQKFDFDQRLQVLSSQDLPVVAEVFLNGKSQLCEILALRSTKDPTVQVQILSSTENKDSKKDTGVVVDIGQITTVWNHHHHDHDQKNSNDPFWDTISDQLNRLPVGSIEAGMDGLYKSYVGRARSSSSSKNTLTKKQIIKLCSNIPNEIERQHAENVLRQVIKAGNGCSRIVDSTTAAAYLYSPDQGIMATSNKKGKRQTGITNTEIAVAAYLLAQDSESGGRYKRMPCTFVDRETASDGKVEALSIINGGWLVVDQSVRAGSEARKFAGRVESSNSQDGEKQATGWTVSDERIAQRLECLAMGEVLSQGDNRSSDFEQSLELDVREALKALGAPTTPEGARGVLVRIGRWSEGQTPGAAQPWSPKILEAASWFASYCGQLKSTKKNALQEDRSDLTNIPFVCVDSKRTSFRDDAIGLRPRSVTGRKVSSASKWEILISIVDVSDMYVDTIVSEATNQNHFKVLRNAAASRAVSRYDLPLGPLHLLPPVALKGLSFETVNPGEAPNSFNRCVTVWVYIDETTGKLLDAGVERSVIRQPVALSYASATGLLEGKVDTAGDKELGKTKQLLAVVERNLNAWSQNRRQNSSAAQKREERLALKEFVASQQTRSRNTQQRDDGQDGFRRTLGHRIVDTSLDLYSYVLAGLMRRAQAFVPQQAGSEQGRGGRVATAPLRRYVDGMAQRQVLSVLCDHGGPAMTEAECMRVSQEATDAYNSISNIRSVKKSNDGLPSSGSSGQKGAVQKLKLHLAGDKGKIMPAVSTGKGNEVVIKGVGAIAKVKGMKQPLKPGKEVLVRVLKIDTETGNLSVNLVKYEDV